MKDSFYKQNIQVSHFNKYAMKKPLCFNQFLEMSTGQKRKKKKAKDKSGDSYERVFRFAVPMFKHEVAQFISLSIPARAVQVHHICAQDLTWEVTKTNTAIQEYDPNTWDVKNFPKRYSYSVFDFSTDCPYSSRTDSTTDLYTPTSESLILLDIVREQKSVWWHTHSPVTVKLSLARRV